MDISTVRDVVISILGILYIFITIVIIIFMIIAFVKIRHMIDSLNKKLQPIRKWLAYIQGCAKGLNDAVNIFK
jgi:hypothetical protein